MKRARTLKRPAVHIDRRRWPCYVFDLKGPTTAAMMTVERGATVRMRGYPLVVSGTLDILGTIAR